MLERGANSLKPKFRKRDFIMHIGPRYMRTCFGFTLRVEEIGEGLWQGSVRPAKAGSVRWAGMFLEKEFAMHMTFGAARRLAGVAAREDVSDPCESGVWERNDPVG